MRYKFSGLDTATSPVNLDLLYAVYECQKPRNSFAEPLFTLVNTAGTKIDAPGYEVLVLYAGGTVCDHSANDYMAHVICRLMGYEGSNGWSSGYRYSMQKKYRIGIDNFGCRSDLLWSSCSYEFHVSDCDHSDDVYLDCAPKRVVEDAGKFVCQVAR